MRDIGTLISITARSAFLFAERSKARTAKLLPCDRSPQQPLQTFPACSARQRLPRTPPPTPFFYFLIQRRRPACETPCLHMRRKPDGQCIGRFACVRLGPPVPLAAEKTTSPVHGGPVDIFRGGQFTKYPVRYLVGDRARNILTKYFVDPFVVL